MKRLSILVAAAFAVVLMADTASAQTKGAVEIGVDNGFVVNINSAIESDGFTVQESRTDVSFDLPLLFWRLGFFVNETWSIEPGVGFSYLSFGDDNGSLTQLNATANVLYNLPSGLFFNAGGTIQWLNIGFGGDSDSESFSQFGFGGGLGYRFPVISEQIMLRFAGQYIYLLESEDDGLPASSNILGTIGLSVMTK